MGRTIEVDLQQDYTAIVELDADGRALGVLSIGSAGPTLGRITDPEGGPNYDPEDVLDCILEEGL